MSNTYFQRLRAIRSEFVAAREVIAYAQRNWDRQNIEREVQVELRQIDMAEKNLEATYFVRLFAEFEGILKNHLARHYPQVRTNKFERVNSLIGKVQKAEGFRIDPALRIKLIDIQLHQNSIAHNDMSSVPVPFASALSSLNTFLAKLSD